MFKHLYYIISKAIPTAYRAMRSNKTRDSEQIGDKSGTPIGELNLEKGHQSLIVIDADCPNLNVKRVNNRWSRH
jgi:hypothetical protein